MEVEQTRICPRSSKIKTRRPRPALRREQPPGTPPRDTVRPSQGRVRRVAVQFPVVEVDASYVILFRRYTISWRVGREKREVGDDPPNITFLRAEDARQRRGDQTIVRAALVLGRRARALFLDCLLYTSPSPRD